MINFQSIGGSLAPINNAPIACEPAAPADSTTARRSIGKWLAPLVGAFLLGGAASAQTATITPDTNQTFAFDTTYFGTIAFTHFEIWCVADCDLLAGGASFGIDLGTSAGGSDIANHLITNPFSTGSFGLSTGFPMEAVIDGSVAMVFATLRHVDDIFDVDRLRIVARVNGEFLTLQGVPEAVAAVPLPAAGWLLLAGVGGLAFLRRRSIAALAA